MGFFVVLDSDLPGRRTIVVGYAGTLKIARTDELPGRRTHLGLLLMLPAVPRRYASLPRKRYALILRLLPVRRSLPSFPNFSKAVSAVNATNPHVAGVLPDLLLPFTARMK
jgi:hypothetical protein